MSNQFDALHGSDNSVRIPHGGVALTRRRAAALLAGALGGLALWVPGAAAQSEAAAAGFVTTIAEQVLTIMRSDASAQAKSRRFVGLIAQYGDVPRIAVFSLGRYAESLPPERHGEYFKLMQAYVARLFLNNMERFRGQRIVINETRRRSARDVIVDSSILFANGRTLDVDWRLVERDGAFKVFDVKVGGVWLVLQQRSVFVSYISQNGGDVDALLSFLRKSVA